MTESITITLPGDLVAEVEPLLQQNNIDLDTFVLRIADTWGAADRAIPLSTFPC